MSRRITAAVVAVFATASAQAADLAALPGEARAGAFVGARITMALGGGRTAAPRASLTLAPVRSLRLADNRNVTHYGNGFALGFSGRRPTLMLGGRSAGSALRLHGQGRVDAERKIGLSTGAWIGIGAVAVLATVLVVANLTCVGEDKDYCGSD